MEVVQTSFLTIHFKVTKLGEILGASFATSFLLPLSVAVTLKQMWCNNKGNGLIKVNEEGRTGFSEGWQGCSERVPEG